MAQTNSPSNLLKNSIWVLALTTLMIWWVFTYTTPDEKHFYQASLLKSRLLRDTPSPRIIIVGGSNIAFGIDSELMEQELGIPVINDGLHVALGIAPLNEIKRSLQPGDIVIISLEYYNFTDELSFYGQPQYLADWVEFSGERIWDVHEPYKQMPSIYMIMLQRKVNRQLNLYLYGSDLEEIRGIYRPDNFNAHGDYVGHLKDPVQTQVGKDFAGYPVNQLDTAYTFLEDFHQYALAQGARVFYEAQAHRQYNCDLTGVRYIKRFFNIMKQRTSIPVLSNIDDLCYPDEYFYDTPYHLNKEGRQVRTEQLIINLKNALTEIK